MKALTRVITAVDWAITLVVSYFLLQFGADRTSRQTPAVGSSETVGS